LFGGAGIGLVLSIAVSIPFQVRDTNLSQTAYLAVTSLLLYGSVCGLGWWVCLKRHGATLRDAGFAWVGAGPVLLMIPACFGLLIVTGAVSIAADSLFGNVPTAQEQVLGEQNTMSVSDLLLVLGAAVVLAPVAEEFLLRGLLYRYVRARRGILLAIIVSATVWAVGHFTPVLIATFFVFGVIEALVAERYKSLYPAIALHALNNTVSVVGLYVYLNR
jgi:membrane protease YdiL (CAAX protease family)